LKNLKLTNVEIAKQACHFEIDVLNEPIGKQDQYGCSLGGLKLITFNPDDSVIVKNLNISENNLTELENNLFLYYTSLTRKTSSILAVQKLNTFKNISTKNNLRRMSKMAIDLFSEFENGTIDNIGNYLDEAWKLKKELTKNISNSLIDDIYSKGIRSGADGGKLLGAGGGGFILFHVPKKNQEHFLFEMKDYRRFDFKFEFDGTKIVYNDKK
jgi:D-glycero-alpha-D-manno-heptose-7-phosphate kinase